MTLLTVSITDTRDFDRIVLKGDTKKEQKTDENNE